ncbi:tyrosine--tRNA ligase [Patescibacteria group bacterium]|nr:tyrosine--tRNA ligase [Patescibacteria group bacterium]MBU4016292.1 tyrosine--tRNA ligase [Patescibacteria group bacterium]MBU4098238.1 tyrosine--tRNA ligase [Patescibacteria group bacterium]
MDKIEELLTRGVANIIPNKQDLEKLLHSGKKLNIYLGIDPTSPHIHLGHAVLLRKLQKFIDLKQGHSITLLIGDFTALVGDTSDKESERPILTEEEIEKNFQTYKKQAEKILDFTQVKIRHNKEWLEKLIYKELLHLKQQFSLNDFISRELIRKRLDEGKRVRLDETEYPIMQGYDSYFMDTDIQIGGTDQTFNMQAGRTLQKNLRNKESFVITTEFLMGTDGRKMSKSWGNAIWLDDTPVDMYAKVMAIEDNLITQYFTLATNISLQEIENMKKTLEKDGRPMEQKKKLAFQIVSELHDKNAALKAAENFKKTVQQKEKPEEMKKIPFPYLSTLGKINIIDLLYEKNITPSRAEAKRLIEQKGVKINNVTILYPDEKIETTKLPIIVQIGKRKFYSIEEK